MAEPRLTVLESRRVLRIARGGRLKAWLGPALRGLGGGRLKARTCRHPVVEQVTKWTRCAGCPLRTGCAYGETVEGEPPGGTVRPFVVAPGFPVAEVGAVGGAIPVTAVFVGPAAGHAGAFWEALRVGGADPLLGLGPDHVLFDVLPVVDDRTSEVELPDPAGGGVASRVRVEFTSPLVLHTREGSGERWLVERPTLSQLLRPWEGLTELWRSAGLEPPSVERVLEVAAEVRTRRAGLREFVQRKSSNRTGDAWDVRGVVGWVEYERVPAGLVTWLEWAGRLHVGTHRVAGAGGWTVAVT